MDASRRFGWWIGGGLLAGIAAVALYVQQLGPAFYKERLARAVAENTGRQLGLEGDLSVAWWPQIRLHATNISLGNAPGFGPAPMLAAEEIEIAVSTLPLLVGRVSMETARIRGLSVRLVRRADGTTNWDDLASKRAEGGASDPGAFAALALGGVDMEGARIDWLDEVQGREVSLDNVRARTGALAFDLPVDFRVSANVRANKPALAGETTFDGTVTYTPRRQRYQFSPLRVGVTLAGKALPGGKSTLSLATLMEVDLGQRAINLRELKGEGLGSQVSGELALTDLGGDNPGGQIRLVAASSDLLQVLRAFDLPGTAELASLKTRGMKLDLEAALDAASNELRIPSLSLQALGASLEVKLPSARLAAPTALQGQLTLQGPNLPLLLALANQWAGGDAKGAQLLQRALAAGGREFAIDAEVDADLSADRPAVPRLRAQVLGSTLEASLVPATLPGGNAGFAGELAANGENLALLKLAYAAVRGLDAAGLAALMASDTPGPERRFALRTTLQAEPTADRYLVQDLSLSWLQVELGANVEAVGLKRGLPGIKGRFSLRGPDLPAAMRRLGLAASGTGGLDALAPGALREFSAKGEFNGNFETGEFGLASFAADALGFRVDSKLSATRNDKSGLRYEGSVALGGHAPGPFLAAISGHPVPGRMQDLKFEMGFKGQDETVALTPLMLRGHLQGKANAVAVSANADGAELAIARNTLSLKRVTLGLGEMQASGSVDLVREGENTQLSGQLNAPPFDLRALLASLGMPVPASRDPATLTRVGLDTAFRANGQGFALGNLSARIDDTTLRGSLEAGDLSVPDFSFKLAADNLDLDRYLPPAASGKGGGTKVKPVMPETALVGLAQIPVETLRRLRVQGELRLDQLTTMGLKVSQVNLPLLAGDGVVGVEPATAELYQGKYRGVARLDVTGEVPQLSLKSDLARVALEPLLEDLAGRRDLAGSVNFEARLSSSGATPDALRKTLAGQATFALRNGVFRGVDVPAVLGAGRLLLAGKLPARLPMGGETAFRALTGTLELRNGVVSNQDMQLDGEDFSLRGSGTVVKLADATMNYEARLMLGRDGPEIPIRCRGPLAGSSCLPDFKALSQRKLSKPLGTAVKRLQEEVKSRVVEPARKTP